MKKFALVLLAVLLMAGSLFIPGGASFAEGDSLQTFKRMNHGQVHVVKDKDQKGQPSFVSGILSEKLTKADAQNAKKFLNKHKQFFKMKDPINNLSEVKTKQDQLGMTHVRLQQMKNGVPVDRNELNIHFNEKNEITAVNGNFNPTIEDIELDTTPDVQENTALTTAKSAVDAPDYVDFEESELIIYPYGEDYHLAYRINLEFIGDRQGNWYVYVDANTGEVIEKYDAMTGFGFFSDVLDFTAEDTGEKSNHGPNPKAIERASRFKPANGSGLGTTGVTKQIVISHGNIPGSGEGSTFYLADETNSDMAGIYTYNMKNTPNQTWLYTDNDASWKDVEYTGDSSSWEVVGQGPAVDAHSNSKIVYDYFLNNHGRNSLDGNGMAIRSRVHYGKEYNNAFWSNGIAMMTYGDGDGKQFIPLAALDVTAHEMTHGITHYNGGLRYRFETGAINEAYSDTFASIVDGRSWDVGEDIMGSDWIANGRTALRSSEDPGKFPVGSQYWRYSIDGEGRYPAHMDEYYYLPANMDNGGVHINCTILQHSAYLVAEEYGMGREVVADTWYRAYDYLHYDASFAEFREAVLQSAIDLYGDGSEEHEAFLQAFDDIGLYEGWSVKDNPRAPLW
ncbi:M4 family metallopeptidase [Pseudalkalibacillus salsuginis]|uniref:M4 family metallopeptidase n=1 Tax=Pseudalkalibacillus salsuginis TaxID=2910972 RepID=UPI001F21F598|nr:M4 family metallopeptidase [Pseudalkalibacillus salsuginis]MCF6410048.1 M4 family metallopeptidase [Pseudalkalibacillus salsuginis]